MERRSVNPWTWQDNFGFSQAIEFSGHNRALVCSGQPSVDVQHFGVVVERMKGNRPASTLLGVQRLAFPPLMIELEATAVA